MWQAKNPQLVHAALQLDHAALQAFAEDTGTVLSKAAALVPSGGTRSISVGSSQAQEEAKSNEEAEGRELAYAGAPARSSFSSEEEQAAPDSATQRIQAKLEPATSGTRRISRDSSAEKTDQAATQAAMDE